MSSQIMLALTAVALATVMAWLAGWGFGHLVGAITRALAARIALDRTIR